MTLLLALDTSTRIASVGVHDGEQVLSEVTWLAGREHSTRLLVEADFALSRVGRDQRELTGLVVARGPGSFTGVRVAISVAKGMAFALQVPLWGVSTLDVVAAMAVTELPVLAVLEAGRGRYATALYEGGRCTGLPRLATLGELAQLILQPTLLIGELNAQARAVLESTTQARLAPASMGARRGGVLAELGGRLAHSGDPGDPRLIDAVYVT